jgi:hypothetical protein
MNMIDRRRLTVKRRLERRPTESTGVRQKCPMDMYSAAASTQVDVDKKKGVQPLGTWKKIYTFSNHYYLS